MSAGVTGELAFDTAVDIQNSLNDQRQETDAAQSLDQIMRINNYLLMNLTTLIAELVRVESTRAALEVEQARREHNSEVRNLEWSTW